jgi:hypothetical protein
MTTNPESIYYGDSTIANAQAVLSILLIATACLFADAVVGLRGIDVGTDTHAYAGVFLAMRDGFVATRFEPGFVLLTRICSATGMSVAAYQAVLFGVSLVAAALAARRYFDYLGGTRGYLTFLIAALMFLFLSPMFVNGSINAVRQGMASFLVFAALLSFQHRRWGRYFLYGILGSSLHYSSLLYLVFAPVLLLNLRLQRIIAVVAFVAYCSGLSMVLVRALLPALYAAVMSYSPGATYRAGVRLDFAVFAMFWYFLPYAASRLIRSPFSERIKQGMAVYLAMLLPFFTVGWGNYSNRYLLAPWVAASFVVAAMFCFARVPFLRHPLLLRGGLVLACGVFSYYVTQQVII